MRILWGLVGLYGILGTMFFLLNPEWAVASFPIRFFGVRMTLPLLLILFLTSLLFLVFLALAATWFLEKAQREKEKLQAQLFEKGITEIEDLRASIAAQIAELEDAILRALRQKTHGEDSQPPSSNSM